MRAWGCVCVCVYVWVWVHICECVCKTSVGKVVGLSPVVHNEPSHVCECV